ncbi:hypothetical protein GF407_13385 [candidate division KSB1 bacterium]|nr:hypothetical protein [candidate division KSB1 bacterium]
MRKQRHLLWGLILSLFLCGFVYGSDIKSGQKSAVFSRDAAARDSTFRARMPAILAAGDTVYCFGNNWSYSTIGLDYDPDSSKFWYAHESQSSTSRPTIYLADSSGISYTNFALSERNPGWPWQLDNRTGIDVMPNGNMLLPDYNGDLSYADDNIVEIDQTGTILNAWEMDDEVGSNDCVDNNEIDSIIDVAVISANDDTIHAFATAAYDDNVLYEIKLIRTGVLWTPNSWIMVRSDTLDNLSALTTGEEDILAIDILSDTLVTSNWDNTLLGYYDLNLNLIDTLLTTTVKSGGYNSGVCFMEETNPLLVATTDFSSDSTRVSESLPIFTSPPVIDDIADQSGYVNTVIGPVSFTVEDHNTDPADLTLSAISGNQTLVPDANISLGGSGSDRTITITPAADQSGSAVITVTVTDDDNMTASDQLEVTIIPVGSTLYVDSDTGVDDPGRIGTQGQPFATIGYAVGRATANDTIDATGTFTAGGVSGDGIVIDKNLTIRGQGADQTIVEGHATDASSADRRCFTISSGTSVTLKEMTLRHGNANGGGAIKHSGDDLLLERCVITDNVSSGSSPLYVGGGIYSTGALTLNSCTVSGNSSLGKGGGIYTTADMDMEKSTISANSAGGSGGGICFYVDSGYPVMNVTNSTISGNSTSSANGGGFSLEGNQNADVNLTNVTIADNSCSGAVFGEGIYASNSGTLNLSLVNCIFDNGTTSNYASPSGTTNLSRSFTLCRDSSMPITTVDNINGSDPLLQALADNNGDTRTHALSANSPAVDAGTYKGVPSEDQRGEFRPQGMGYDMGAYERTPQTFFVNSVTGVDDSDQSGSILAPWATIMYAINRSEVGAGDIINTTGTFTADGVSSAGIVVDKSLTISGQVGLPTIVQGNPVSADLSDRRCFTINAGKTVTLMNMVIRYGNAGSNDGGGIYNSGILNVVNCSVQNNKAANGGGIYSDGQLRVAQSTVSGNSSTADGGGVYAYTSDPAGIGGGFGLAPFQNLSLLNCTLSGNSTDLASGNGGGIVLHAESVSLPTKLLADVTNVTIANNICGTTGDGAGIYQLAETAGSDSAVTELRIKNSILSGGTSKNYSAVQSGSPSALVLARSYTLCRDNSMNIAGEGNLNNTDPLLSALADNGGDTQTHAISKSSPANNAGTGNSIWHLTDQRGLPLIGAPDMGSYEVQSQGVKLGLNLLLQGPYDADGDTMQTLLQQSALIPLTSPYSEDPVTLTQLPAADLVDWILVQLLSADGSSVAAVQSAFLTRDGTVVSTAGADSLEFEGLGNDAYIIQVKHRNHLQAQSASAVLLVFEYRVNYDFTAENSTAGKNNLVELETGVWGLPAGDADQDGAITSPDYVIWYNQNEEGDSGYVTGDFQLNGTLDKADYSFWKENSSLGLLFQALN